MGYKEPTLRALTADLSCQAIIRSVQTYSSWNRRRPLVLTFSHQLMVLGVSEADEGQVVAGEGLRGRKALDRSLVLHVVEVSGVVVARQLVHDRRHVVADGDEVPDVVLEEGMLLDLVDASVAKPT